MLTFHYYSDLQQKEVVANKGETKTAAAGAGKKDEGHITVVLKTDVHCDGCAKKVKRIVKQFKGNYIQYESP